MQLHESIPVSFHVLSVNIEIILCIPNTVYTKFDFGYSEKAAKKGSVTKFIISKFIRHKVYK